MRSATRRTRESRVALAMTEKEKEKAEKKSDEEIMELNLKLLAAAESGKAELIRQLVEEGADGNYASFVPDEDDICVIIGKICPYGRKLDKLTGDCILVN